MGKSSPCSGGSRFPLLLSKWSFTICPVLYDCKLNVLSVSLIKKIPSFHFSNGYVGTGITKKGSLFRVELRLTIHQVEAAWCCL